MRKFIIIILIIMLAGFAGPSYGTENDTLQPPPEVSARNAILIEANSGEVLYEKNAEEKAYPASITKIMTALLAIENGTLDKKVKISENAAGVEGSSIYLAPGEMISLRDLVYGLMLRSGNDAAIAISEEIGGSTNNFVIMMNKKARELGACNTNFMNPNGLHDPEHYTTAKDMALIARAAMKNAEFKKVAATKSWVTDRGEGKYNYFYNKNKVVYQYNGGTGIKIGYTKAAGRTLVASSERDGMELICVVMNAPDWFQDTYKLMDYAYSQYETTKIAIGQRPIKAVKIWGGNKDFVQIGSREDILCPVKKGVESKISIMYVLPKHQVAPISRWQEAGCLKIYVNGNYLFSKPLHYLEDLE
ncbi:MAG TPA: D-alanyl-D-alanine carboxypeptidase family protein [Anaerovoracaceae bacterium]|nr:D-alanyl-D-alanine carboxypeptidase family protein [Anaerovoracaceae bacterium]